ncbi:putative mitochondrial protein AtMg00820 [Nicotiana tabacum]|uniref:Mitochondrial protein AtMg00820 n=1 Tax=Nicotiana tabacum TaxID=4097 RepID=A0AC58TKW3_TOBAC
MGCLCYATITEKVDRFSPRAIAAVKMGYSESQKGYKLYVPKGKKFFVNRDVTFSEDIFPFQSMKRTTDTPLFLELQDDQTVHQASPTHVETQHTEKVTDIQKYKSFSAVVSAEEPTSFVEVMKDPRWVEAMKAEVDALVLNNTWEVVDIPKRKVPIGCRWVYKIKYKSNGEVERFKARLVARDYSQQEGLDYQETFSLVVKMVTVRAIISLAAINQ